MIVRCLFLSVCCLLGFRSTVCAWGFYAHRQINRLAVFTLPAEMIPFFKQHIQYLTDNAVNPDKRRNLVKEEAPRHYIDLDSYGDSALTKLPKYWSEAKQLIPTDTLHAHGIAPWHLMLVKYQLTEAMRAHNTNRILALAADFGHYIADVNVPLHTTHNYNGQLSGQKGIHGLWESRLPELMANQYDFFVGTATYVVNPQQRAWAAVAQAHLALDSVFAFEIQASNQVGLEQKYGFEERSGNLVRVYSVSFSRKYHQLLGGQVERQMRAAIKMVGDMWYTCWVDAGQPNLLLTGANIYQAPEAPALTEDHELRPEH